MNEDELHKTKDATSVITEKGEYHEVSNEYSSPPKSKWERFVRFIEVQKSEGLTMKQMFLLNDDLRPVEEARRLWSWYNYVFFWIADSLNVNSWQIAATGVSAGMNWWQTWLSVWFGYTCAAFFVVMMARIGSYYHTSFPVSCRSSFGVFGSLWPVINRVVMAIIWFATQTWIMGQCVQLMLKAIFGNDLDTRIGTQNLSGTTSFQFLSFFIAWVIQLPFIWFPPHTIRHLFTVKTFVVPVAGFGMLIWTILRADGLGETMHEKSELSSHDLGWAWVSSFMNCVANFAALIVNAPDFSRFAKTPGAALTSQLVTIPMGFGITTLIGILCAAASKKMYGESLWSPLEIMDKYLDSYTSGDRGGVFMIACALALGQIGTNIAANSISAGTDMTALLPQFMSIRRGGFICAGLALCICPWNFFSSSNNFTTYLSAYSVFLSSIAGVIACDYYVMRRGKLNLMDLYSGSKEAPYYYTLGCNWRAYAAYLLGLVPNMPGFAEACGQTQIPQGAVYVYKLNYFVGFLVSFILYYLFCWLSPLPGPALPKSGWHEEWQDVEDFDTEIRVQNVYGSSTGSSI